MKKEGKLLLLVLSLFFLSVIFVSAIHAADTPPAPTAPTDQLPTPGDVASSSGNFLTGFFDGTSKFWTSFLGFQNIGFAKILLFFLVALVIYGISELLPFLGSSSFVKWGISIVIALLATLYLNQQEIYTILVSYSALGITLTAIIPFIIIAVISKKENGEGRVFTSKILWVVFLLVLFLKALSSWKKVGAVGQWVYLVIALLSIIMLIWEGRIYYLLFKQEVKAGEDIAKSRRLARMTARLDQLAQEIEAAETEATRNVLLNEYEDLRKKQNRAGGNYRPYGSI